MAGEQTDKANDNSNGDKGNDTGIKPNSGVTLADSLKRRAERNAEMHGETLPESETDASTNKNPDDKGADEGDKSGAKAQDGTEAGESQEKLYTRAELDEHTNKVVKRRLKRAAKNQPTDTPEVKEGDEPKANEGAGEDTGASADDKGTAAGEETKPAEGAADNAGKGADGVDQDEPDPKDFKDTADYEKAFDMWVEEEDYTSLLKDTKEAVEKEAKDKNSVLGHDAESDKGIQASIVQAVLDKHKAGLFDDLSDGIKDGSIVLDDDTLEIMSNDDDTSVKLSEVILENPHESKRLSRVPKRLKADHIAKLIGGGEETTDSSNPGSSKANALGKLDSAPVTTTPSAQELLKSNPELASRNRRKELSERMNGA